MSAKPKRRRSKVNATGRTKGSAKFALFHQAMVETPAWVKLSGDAFKLLCVLYLKHNGRNNGDIYLSVREAARLIGVTLKRAHKLFRELEEKGFIKTAERGWFGHAGGHATRWAITEFAVNDRQPTKDYKRWAPEAVDKAMPTQPGEQPEEFSPVPPRGTQRTPTGNANRAATPSSVPPRGTLTPDFDPSSVPPRGTVLVCHLEGAERPLGRVATEPEGHLSEHSEPSNVVGPLGAVDNRRGAADDGGRGALSDGWNADAIRRLNDRLNKRRAEPGDTSIPRRPAPAADPDIEAAFAKKQPQFGEAVAELRDRRGISLEAYAAHLGVQPQTWARIEGGVQPARPLKRKARAALVEMNGSELP